MKIGIRWGHEGQLEDASAMNRQSNTPGGPRSHEQWCHVRDAARSEAEAVLRQVANDQAAINARHAELGLNDPIVEVTGMSALDHAIASVRTLIENLDTADEPITNGVIGRIPLPDPQAAPASQLPLHNR